MKSNHKERKKTSSGFRHALKIESDSITDENALRTRVFSSHCPRLNPEENNLECCWLIGNQTFLFLSLSLPSLAFRLDVIILVTNDCMLIQAAKCLRGVNDEEALKWQTMRSFASFFHCCDRLYRHQRHVNRYYSIRSNNDANGCRKLATTRWADAWGCL